MNAPRVQTEETNKIGGSRDQVHSQSIHVKPLGLKRPVLNVCVDTKLKMWGFIGQIKNMSDSVRFFEGTAGLEGGSEKGTMRYRKRTRVEETQCVNAARPTMMNQMVNRCVKNQARTMV